jgi:hypothetical protein
LVRPYYGYASQGGCAAQEEQRLQVPRAFLEGTSQDSHYYVQGRVAEPVCKLDEVGILDWQDRKTKKGVVHTAMLGQTRHHGVTRNVKHISVNACMSAAGESLLHHMVTSQNSPTVQEHLKRQGIRFGRNFALKFKQKLYFNAGIFFDYIRTVFISYIDARPALAVFAQEVAAVLMDNCLAHASDDAIRIPTQARVRVITFAPHTIQVFQVLDLTPFGVLKRPPRYELPFDENHATVKVRTKVYHDFTQPMGRSNVW